MMMERLGDVLLLGVATALALTGCSTTATTTDVAPRDVPRAADVTLEVVRKSQVQRFVREAPAVVRSGIARLVTMVPLDDAKTARLAPAVARAFFVERLENETAVRVEGALTLDEIGALSAALDDPAVAAVVAAAVAQEPEGKALERFVEDPRSLSEERRARVRKLVELIWSSSTIDRLVRAPVSAAGRCVAAAVHDDDDGRRNELLRIAEHGRASDPDTLVVAFAFLWRNVTDDDLDTAHRFFASDVGRKSHQALLDAALNAVFDLAVEVERAVAQK